jgi:hypothetical protein
MSLARRYSQLDRYNLAEPRSWSTGLLLILGLLVGGAGYAAYQHDWVVAVSLLVISLGGWLGYRYGGWNAIAFSACVAMGFLASPYVDPPLRTWWDQKLGFSSITDTAWRSLIVSLIACGAFSILIPLGLWLRDRLSHWERIDRNVGLALGLTQTTAGVLLVLWALVAMGPQLEKNLEVLGVGSGSQTITWTGTLADLQRNSFQSWALVRCREISNATQASLLAPLVTRWNPYTDWEPLRKRLDLACGAGCTSSTKP